MTVKRVVLAIDSLGSGGAQRQMVALARGLVDRGVACTLFNYYPQYDHFRPDIDALGIPVVDAPKKTRLDWSVPRRLRQTVAEHRAQAVISFLDTPNVYAVLSALGRQVRCIVSERSSFVDGRPSRRQALVYQAYRLADAIVANSHFQADLIAQHFAWARDRVHVVYNGVDTDRFAPGADKVTAASSTVRLLSVGTITAGKNVLGLIQALKRAVDAGQDIEVHWAGKRPADEVNRAYAARCDALIAETQLESRWHWLGERLDMNETYRQFNGVVHPSFFEGLPNAICEAFASGQPVLAGAVCEHPRLVDAPHRGVLFDPTDSADIGDALVRFSRLSLNERRAMGANARRFAEDELSLPRFADAYCALLGGVA
ncbi:MAG: glycosyltransferase family 4 protein [Pseudomonadota bacterium]